MDSNLLTFAITILSLVMAASSIVWNFHLRKELDSRFAEKSKKLDEEVKRVSEVVANNLNYAIRNNSLGVAASMNIAGSASMPITGYRVINVPVDNDDTDPDVQK